MTEQHNRRAQNCEYMAGELDLSATCPVCRPLLGGTAPVGREYREVSIVGSDEPTRRDEEFTEEQMKIKAMFSPPQVTQVQLAQVEQLSEDFAALGQRIANVLPHGEGRRRVLDDLSDVYLRLIRTITLP